MNDEQSRLRVISNVLKAQVIGNQDDLQRALQMQGYEVTQATLSRDLRDLRAEKKVASDGTVRYVIPANPVVEKRVLGIDSDLARISTISVEMCGQFAVVKTRPGFANAVAYEIDSRAQRLVIGTIAGDDTILVIPREGVSRQELREFLATDLNS